MIEPLLQDVLAIVCRDAPHLQWLFDVFAQEASFGLAWLAPDLIRLDRGAAILEVGAGLMLLSCQLAAEGFKVTALEPVGEGFSEFKELQKIVLAYAQKRGIEPAILAIPVEQLNAQGEFDFAFSVNVMEHVGNVAKALETVGQALRPGAAYRFTCANYLFPYEPHFNIPTLFSKSLTERFFHRRIFSDTRVVDAQGVWKSLNWITVPQVVHAVRNLPEMSVALDRRMLESSLLRVVHDPQFSARRSPWVRSLVKCVVRTGLYKFARWVPPLVQPSMDCSMRRRPMGQ
jgi:SAM-dependent methyltransferase